MFTLKKEPIYKHDKLDMKEAEKLRPLFESAFASEFKRYQDDKNPNRQKIGEERMRFATEQFANRMRVADIAGVSPLNEDMKIFGALGENVKKLFEDYSTPGNIINMGNVRNPMDGTAVKGGMWNSAYKPGTGDIPSYVFGLQSQLALNCIGFDLLPTLAVDTPKVVINFIDTVYGGGALDSVESLPSYLEFGDVAFTYNFAKENGLKRAATVVTFVAKDGKAVKTRYIIRSTIKAALICEVLSTGDYADGKYTETNKYSVKDVIDSINTNGEGKVYVDGVADATDLSKSVTINYVSAIRNNIAEAASNNNTIGGMSRAQMEKGVKNKLNIVAMDKQLEMVGIEIEADTTNIQIKDLAAMGVNAIGHLYTGVQNQLVQTLDETILDELYKVGVQHAVNAKLSQGVEMSLFIAAPSETSISYTDILAEDQFLDVLGNDQRAIMGSINNSMQSSAYENQMTHADRLYGRLLKVAEFIGYDNRIAPADFVVLSAELCATLKKNANYSACPHVQTLSDTPELVYSGSIYNTIAVYKNPKIGFSDPRILMGRRGDETDQGLKLLAYDLASSRQTIAEGTMSDKIRVWSRFAIAPVGFYPELNYMTFCAVNQYDWI